MYDTTQSIRLLIDIAKNSSELSDLRSEGTNSKNKCRVQQSSN